jgi:hypothetical protein
MIRAKKPITRLAHSLSPPSRAAIDITTVIPAMNRWTIFIRPLRGLMMKVSFMNAGQECHQ